MPTSLKILCKYSYSQKSGYRTTTTKDHMNHWEEKHQWNTMPCRRHAITRPTLKKIELLITTIFKFENSPGCQSENREGYTGNREEVKRGEYRRFFLDFLSRCYNQLNFF